MELLFGGMRNLFSCLADWLFFLFRMFPFLSPGVFLFLFAGILLWIFSGVLAADCAERGGCSPKIHFAAGLLLPYLYPFVLRCFLKPAETWEPDPGNGAVEGQRVYAAETAASASAGGNFGPEPSEEETSWSQARMERLRYRPDGSDAGPFSCRLSDGSEYRVLRVVMTLADVVSFEIEPSPGRPPVTVRFPYARIASLEQAAPALEQKNEKFS